MLRDWSWHGPMILGAIFFIVPSPLALARTSWRIVLGLSYACRDGLVPLVMLRRKQSRNGPAHDVSR